ncbi:MAG TPA: histidine--tRNA ligase [Acidimicrobiales bacterium]|nr:histidine--tRNA ligase [Acidimicrobiales bacterium]
MAERAQFRAPKGTQDVLPPESARWEAFLATFADHARRYGYGLLQSPMFEELGVFQRLGEGTDVVTKEMYDFEDKGGRHIALRPEGTAPVARAFVEHHPPTPWKVWYATPAFRYERPQAGRLRQHHQVGIEAIGSADPDLDVEVIAFGASFLRALGLERWRLVLNFMGTPTDRAAYAEVLQGWLRPRAGDLAPEDAEKVEGHPLRVLDSKRDATRAVLADAPRMADSLDDASIAHGERVQAGLRSLGLEFELDPTLVRGLDYYTHTLFEMQSDALGNAQSTLLGGGRYDGLIEQLGGAPTPGIGFGCGIERVLLTCDAEGVFAAEGRGVDCFVVDVTGAQVATVTAERLRARGVAVERGFDARSMKAQMRSASKSGARFALIIGEQEAADGTVTIRDLQTGEEWQEPLGEEFPGYMATIVGQGGREA